jgi:hypothetical protein
MTVIPEFTKFPKMARLSREVLITEKIDGTNAQILITEDGDIFAGSRSQWITTQQDNHGFARWVEGNKTDLSSLGPGRHFGEWWGLGIQRGYALKEKRFSLFNISRWSETRPACCHVVPLLHRGVFDTWAVSECLADLAKNGSIASPDFMTPEGVVIFHIAGNVGFKRTIEKDDEPKSLRKSKEG